MSHWNEAQRKVIRLLAVAAVLVLADASNAGWQYTEWGMTPENVVKASGGVAEDWTPEPGWRCEGCRYLEAPYSAGSLEFHARLRFENGRLISVMLVAKQDDDHFRARLELERRYGTPVCETTGSCKWRDESRGNIVIWSRGGTLGNYINYIPLETNESQGM